MPLVKATEETILAAADALARGDLVAFPTETVYGLGADARNGKAVARIFEVKGRPQFNPLIVHVADLKAARDVAEFPPLAIKLAQKFWPGALTLVLTRNERSGISDLVSAGLDTIALRVPAHPVAQQLLKSSGVPIAAPSANRSGHVSPTRAQHVFNDLMDRPAFILDGGPTEVGLESTVVGFDSNQVYLLRSGGIPRAQIEEVAGVGLIEPPKEGERPVSPGQLLSHYAPHAGLRLDAKDARSGEAYLGFGPQMPAISGINKNLSAAGDLTEAAANLFAALRELDAAGPDMIAVAPIPNEGLGEAINDRLKRAAAPRDG